MTATRIRQFTCERLRTIGVTEAHPDPTFHVFDSRTTPLDAKELPALVVVTTPARVETASLGGGRWVRNQTLVIVGEFEAPTDEALAAAADATEAACWQALMAHQEWFRAWDHLLSWNSEAGRDAQSQTRRGVVKLTLAGDFAQGMPEPDDLTPLREIRATAGLDGTTDPGFETRIECAGAHPQPSGGGGGG